MVNHIRVWVGVEIIVFIVILILILSLIFFPAQKDRDVIKIGLPTILSGDFASGGQNIVNSAQLAIEKINQKGGINGQKIVLIPEDAKCDSSTGLSAVQKLINVDKVQFIIDGMCSNGLLASAPAINGNKIVSIRPVTGGKNVDEAGEYIFRTGHSDILAGAEIAEEMMKQGYKRAATVAEITEYTQDIKNSFKERLTALGGAVIIEEDFLPDARDFRTIISKIKEEEIEAILIASQTGIGGADFIKQSRELNLNITMFSDFTFITNKGARDIVGSFEGIYYADPEYNRNNPGLLEFFREYEERFGTPPLIPFHSAATYDSVQILAKAAEEAGTDSEKAHDWLLKNVKDWKGFSGTFSLDNKGNSDVGFVVRYYGERD